MSQSENNVISSTCNSPHLSKHLSINPNLLREESSVETNPFPAHTDTGIYKNITVIELEIVYHLFC